VQSSAECLDGKKVSTLEPMPPYPAMVVYGGDGSNKLLDFSCSGTMECSGGMLGMGRSNRGTITPLVHSLHGDDTDRLSAIVTSAQEKSLLTTNSDDFTKLVMNRDAVRQASSPMNGYAGGNEARNIFWERMLNLGPLLLLLIDKLLGRL
jgi:hypothetical protein